MTNLFVVVDESIPDMADSLPVMLKDAGVDYLDLRGEDSTIPKLTVRDGPNWLLVPSFPDDLQGASTVWIGKGTPAEAADFNIDATDKTATQIISEVNELVDHTVEEIVDPPEPAALYAVWQEPTEEGMLALTPAGDLVLTREPTVPHPDPLLMKEALRQWQRRITMALDEPDKQEVSHVDGAAADEAPAPARLKYLNRIPTQDIQERNE